MTDRLTLLENNIRLALEELDFPGVTDAERKVKSLLEETMPVMAETEEQKATRLAPEMLEIIRKIANYESVDAVQYVVGVDGLVCDFLAQNDINIKE